jgi:hypothetical protein
VKERERERTVGKKRNENADLKEKGKNEIKRNNESKE